LKSDQQPLEIPIPSLLDWLNLGMTLDFIEDSKSSGRSKAKTSWPAMVNLTTLACQLLSSRLVIAPCCCQRYHRNVTVMAKYLFLPIKPLAFVQHLGLFIYSGVQFGRRSQLLA